jgi:hypothetical protein
MEPKAIRDALDAIGQLNQELLAVLVLKARRDSAQSFPLADSLRARFEYLTAAEIRAISHCGVLLADVEFTVAARWQHADGACDSSMDQDHRGHWLTQDQAIAFGVAVLMLAWHVVHTAPGISGVLLGMSEAVLAQYRKLGINDLVGIAQKPPRWIKPRWIDSPEIWTDIIDLATDPISKGSSKMTLHCLKLSAAYSPRLMATVSSQWP